MKDIQEIMKDIQEIMKDMNVVTDEMAITVQQVVPGMDLGLACNCADACSGIGGLTACGERNLEVEALPCIITAPRNFVFNNSTANSTIAYSLADLRALVEPCSCTATGTRVYAIRVVGCISYTVNVPLAITTGNCYVEFQGDDPIPDFNPTVYACCCCGSANVDNILGFTCSIEGASFVSGLINNLFLTCAYITPALTVDFNSPTVATATATFNLPDLCTNGIGLLSKK